VVHRNGTAKLKLAPNVTPQDVLHALMAQQVTVEKFEIAVPTLDEVFVRAVSDSAADEQGAAVLKELPLLRERPQ
jgi:ABC-type uncharacterized transport system ATPase subunit